MASLVNYVEHIRLKLEMLKNLINDALNVINQIDLSPGEQLKKILAELPEGWIEERVDIFTKKKYWLWRKSVKGRIITVKRFTKETEELKKLREKIELKKKLKVLRKKWTEIQKLIREIEKNLEKLRPQYMERIIENLKEIKIKTEMLKDALEKLGIKDLDL